LQKQIPRITTRGYYDLTNGSTLKSNSYYLYPKKSFEKLRRKKEITIMIHGLQNNKAGAVAKFKIAQQRLRALGYRYPVVGFSYDANTKGAHLKKSELHAIRVGQKIAKKNGRNLAKFILDFKKQNPVTKIRLMGHSLGSEVILSTLQNLYSKSKKPQVETVHFFGASLPSNFQKSNSKILKNTVNSKIVNCYSPDDEVLRYSQEKGYVKNPLGLCGSTGKTISKYVQKKVKPKNHRFVSYAVVLKQFP
jgi:esterase/lipase superfamily enzyme